jgi:ubiquinone/menaquinone biosynthesis C-methylase UbiE
VLDSYSDIADEYYDRVAHPTCNNFRFLSEQFLATTLLQLWSQTTAEEPTLEVGAGRSIVAPLLERVGSSLRSLTLQDISPGMLQHSREWLKQTHHLVCDARNVPLSDASQAFVVSSLGDPYNDEDFLREVSRLLRADGHFLITAPSEAWASAFRGRTSAHDAEFVLRDGRSHYVPSITWDPGLYITTVEGCGLTLREFRTYQRSDVVGPLSPKLRVNGFSGPVLDGYWFQKNQE